LLLEDGFKFLPNIRVQDALLVPESELRDVTHAIMNPPFSIWPSPLSSYWKKGKVNAAGIMFDKYLRLLPNLCTVSAILPDVLRSGTRYDGFRQFVSSKLRAKCTVWGRFSPRTEVDVFILSGQLHKDNNTSIEWHRNLGDYESLSQLYDVSTGPLVAYRDPEEGELFPYFHPKNCPAWAVVEKTTESRRFNGRLVKPPVVLVKRTSSPSARYRASATVINVKGLIAVENHMIVIKPKSCRLEDCHKLLSILKSQKTNDYLNDRARMRHLTTRIIKGIPLE